MEQQELIHLVRKYLAGTATPTERTFVEAWYREMDSSRSIDSILTAAEVRDLEETIFQSIRARIDQAPAHRIQPVVRTIRPGRFAAIAASLIIIVTGSWLLYRHYTASSPVFTTITTQPGKVRKVILNDGSQVWLNALSTLRFATAFGSSGSRELFLEGEAYFEVAKDEQHPFVVHTRDLSTRVLGTRFNVNAYPGSHPIEVTLLEGKVMLAAAADTLYLAPDQKATFTANNLHVVEKAPGLTAVRDSARQNTTGEPRRAALIREPVDHASDAAAWREGNLIFRNTVLEEIMPSLARKYNIRIQSDPALLRQPVTIVITANQSAEDALLEVTRQLKRVDNGPQRFSAQPVQYRKEDSVYYIE